MDTRASACAPASMGTKCSQQNVTLFEEILRSYSDTMSSTGVQQAIIVK